MYSMYIGFKTSFYVVRHLDSIASCLPTGFHLGFFRSWLSLYPPSSSSSVFLVLYFVLASTSMLFWVKCNYAKTEETVTHEFHSETIQRKVEQVWTSQNIK